MKEKKAPDFLNGSLWDKLLLFALPIAVSSMLQQLFNAADMAIVGRFESSFALAAVGSNAPVINLLVNTFTGLAVGANAVIAGRLGAGDKEAAGKAAHTAILVALWGGVALAALGIWMARPLLTLIDTPAEVLDMAVLYLQMYFAGSPFIMLYNFGAAILRSQGDTRRPFLCLMFAGVINVCLNLVFVVGLGMSVAGVALATVLANIISAGLVARLLLKETGPLRIVPRQLAFHGPLLKSIIRIGLPAGLQCTVFCISNIYVQSAINSLGADAMAASAAVMNYEWISYYFVTAFAQASLTFVSQNYGAGLYGRCSRAAWLSQFMALASCLAMCFFFFFTREWAMGLYTTEAEVIRLGSLRMYYCMLPLAVGSFMDVMASSIRGMGVSVPPAVIILLGSCVLRIWWVHQIFPQNPTYLTLMIIYPISWVLTGMVMLAAYLVISRRQLGPGARGPQKQAAK